MATLTTTGNLSTILAADFNDFWDAFEGAANTFCVATFSAMELFTSTSDVVPDGGFPTATELQGSSANAEGDIVIIGTGLLNYDTPGGTGTITSITFDSTNGANSGDSFTFSGSAQWTYESGFVTGGLDSVTIHHGADVLTITSAQGDLAPDDTGTEFTGTVSSLTLTTGGITVTLLGSFKASDQTGTLTSISFTEGANSFTLKGKFDALTFFDNPNFTTVNDLFDEVTFFTGNDVFTINDSSSLEWHGHGGADKLTGGANADTLFGDALNDSLIGLGGNDTLDGGTGVDAMTGGLGDDYYFADNSLDKAVELVGGGDDTVESTASYVLGVNVDDLLLAGSGHINGTGNALDNVITGNSGNNTLNGGIGADTMIGGGGDDTFVVDNINDSVTDSSGNDTVLIAYNTAAPATVSTSDFTNIENLKVTGTGLFNLTGNGGNNILTGNASVNTLTGNGGQDTLDGGAGADIMIGGSNDTTYVVDNAGDSITDTGGTDTIVVKLTSGTYTLVAGLENLTLFGTGSTNGTGNIDANIITGNTGANILNGGAGADSMIGGTGADTYVVDDANDTVTEVLAGGIDTVRSSVNFDLATDGANIEKLTLVALAGDIDGTGNALANVIAGNEGDNTLDGGGGIDTLIGGAGDDTLIVDLLAVSGVLKLQDIVVEVAGGGIDTLVQRSSGTLVLTKAATGVLSSTVENVDISQTFSTMINLTGNTLANIMTGNDWDNTLNGLGGNDTMNGGNGNDTYIFSSASDVANEDSGGGAGNDTLVIAYATLVPATINLNDAAYDNIENLKVTGAGLYNLIGDSDDNILTGNTSVNTLTGGDGHDTYFVGAGDVVIEDLNNGTDTVMSAITWALGNNIEKLVLTGTSAINGTGNDLDNTITGNSGANTLDGGAGTGSDSLIGGAGNDIYKVYSVSDQIIEGVNGGTDTVNTYVDFNLATNGGNVENITILGTIGHAITGNDKSNILTGSTGDDFIDGSLGADKMIGGLGNDAYYVDNLLDIVTESSSVGGTDLVSSSTISWTLGSNLENLSLAGSALSGTGNTLSNTLTGNASGNTLNGAAGNDTLIGGDGLDTLIGGTGADTFVFDDPTAYNNIDIVTDFNRTLGDILDISDLLTGYTQGVDTLSDFVQLIADGTSTQVWVDENGAGGSGPVQIATLLNTTGLAAILVSTLETDGTLMTA